MNQYKFFVIIVSIISVLDLRISGQISAISNVHRLQHHIEYQIISGKRQFPATRNYGDIFELIFGVLLPEQAIGSACSLYEALSAVELAIKKLQQYDGLLEQYNICVEYRDIKTSSVHASLASFDLYSKKTPGSLFCFAFIFFCQIVFMRC